MSAQVERVKDEFWWFYAPLTLGQSSTLKHLLVGQDAQLEPVISGPLGSFRFLQLYCITEDEIRAVQRWNGPGTGF